MPFGIDLLIVFLSINLFCKPNLIVHGNKKLVKIKGMITKNGINIMVPPFVEEGDKIILDTRSLEYVKKVN